MNIGIEHPKKLSSISMVFPAYNDGGTIASMIIAAIHAASQITDDWEVIVVNDGSTDYTASILEELDTRYPELRVIHHSSNQGYGAALRTGFCAAAKEWVFYTDGDAQYNPLELTNLVEALHENVDAVNGFKIARNDSIIRKLVGRAYHYFVKLLFGIRIRDVDCDFRLIPRKIFNEIKLTSTSGSICLELVKKIEYAGYIFAEVPVHHYPRKYGASQFFVPWRIIQTFKQLYDLYWTLVIKKEHLHKKTN